jgi:hypothetical protein
VTTPPRLRLVSGGAPPEQDDDRRPADTGPDDDEIVDAAFPDDAPGRARAQEEAAQAAARAARRATLARQVVAGGVGFQFLATLRYMHWYVSLIRDGAVSLLALLAVPACLALYVAAGLLLTRRAPGACRTLFLAGAMTLAFSVPFWGITDDWTWPLELGATLALAGAWYTRPAVVNSGSGLKT